MPRILLYEPRPDYAKQLCFLLHLGDFHCTQVLSVDEILNWLCVGKNTNEIFDLILLGALLDPSDGRLLLEARAQGKTPPIVYQQREGEVLPDYFTDQVRVCSAAKLLPCLHECLTRE